MRLWEMTKRTPARRSSGVELIRTVPALVRPLALSAALVFLGLLLSACSLSGSRWYKDGLGQADFDKDNLECGIIADSLAREESMTGAGIDPQVRATALNNCLYRKGWTNIPPNPASDTGRQAAPAPAGLARLEQGKLQGLCRSFDLPASFSLLSDTTRHLGPTVVQSIAFARADGVVLTFVFQQSVDRVFAEIDYPVAEPFFLYRRGREGRPASFRWAAFAGKIQDGWVGGLGAYLFCSPRERLTVVVTRPLPEPESKPPAGLRLSQAQHRMLADFTGQSLVWLKGH